VHDLKKTRFAGLFFYSKDPCSKLQIHKEKPDRFDESDIEVMK
jgi:hypothetical protein